MPDVTVVQDSPEPSLEENDNRVMQAPTNEPHTPASELQMCHSTISDLEGRVRDLEAMLTDYENRLQKQEQHRIHLDYLMKRLKENYEEKIMTYEKKIGDMMMHIRTRDRQFVIVEEKNRRAQKHFQTMQLKKHEIAAQARREEREAMKRERAIDTRQAASTGATAGGNHGHGPSAAGMTDAKGDDMRRTPSSGSFIARALAAQGNRGVRARGPDMHVRRPEQVRAALVEENLTEFFQLS